jgi:hypothetical protein
MDSRNPQISAPLLRYEYPLNRKLTDEEIVFDWYQFPSSFPMFPAHHGANSSGFYRCQRSSGTKTKGAFLIYGLLMTPPVLGLVEFFGGSKW